MTLLASDGASLLLRGISGYNLWLQYIAVPLQNSVMLWALSHWQDDPVPRLAFRVGIPVYLLALLTLLPGLQPNDSFDQFTWPFQALVLLAASLYTLVNRAAAEPEGVTGRDWFWITLGASLFFSLRVALQPFVRVTMPTHPDLARLAYVLSAWTDIAAYLLIARGMVCPLPQARSGGFLSWRRWRWS